MSDRDSSASDRHTPQSSVGDGVGAFLGGTPETVSKSITIPHLIHTEPC